MSAYLKTNIEYLKGIGPSRAELLKKELKIFSYADLLKHFPYRYEDRSSITPINQIGNKDHFIQVKGKITYIGTEGTGHKKRLYARFRDESGEMELVWFKGVSYMAKFVKPGNWYIAFGKATSFGGKHSMVHPELSEYLESNKTQSGLHGKYPLTEGLKKRRITSKIIRDAALQIVQSNQFTIQEYLPNYILKECNLISRQQAYKFIHGPNTYEEIEVAKRRIVFDEFFLMQFKAAKKNTNRKQKLNGHIFKEVGSHFNSFYKDKLSFELTNAQKRVIKEIRKDLGSGYQMNRLLQGDVGSGKTIVSLLISLLACDNGFQACLMAPTEILAQQHYTTISNALKGMPVEVTLLTGSTKQSDRKVILPKIENGDTTIIIGTHALLESPVKFAKLGLAIIDEQHRFGVAQRAKLWLKNQIPPHILVMTATPIPRTLAMTIYGDLDTSIIDELPAGRKPIKTVLRSDNHRLAIMHFIKEELSKGRQAYFVFPLIEESSKLELKDLMNGYSMVVDHFPLPKYQVGIMHGKLKPEEKEAVMELFKNGSTDILISTTVIEVGVDVPNASVMVIENAERFGLSQLHQLRGRVGRGSEDSYCILVSSHKLSQTGKERLSAMVETNNGFEIAAKDLKIRGPGNIEGTQQSGILDLKLADIIKDENLLVLARTACNAILDKDPNLENPENTSLKEYYLKLKSSRTWGNIS